MQILKPRGPLSGFWAVGLDGILPEAIDVGELWFATNYRIGPHLHRHWELGYVVEGTSRIGIMGGRELILRPGSLWCFPPNLNHWVEHGGDLKHHQLWTGFDLRSVEKRNPEWRALQSLREVVSADGLTHLERHFMQVIREGTTSSAHQGAGLRLALDVLVLEVVRAITEPQPPPSPVALHPAISKALNILEGRFRQSWTLDTLAEEVGLSRGRLAELFNRETGSSIHKFLTVTRVRRAETLLGHSDLPIGDIASECGFATIQHFSRVFREQNSQTPIEFRRQTRRNAGTAGPVSE